MNINFPSIGQINLDSTFGKCIHSLIKENNINKVLETGTWNGCGSTRILYESIKDTDNPKLVSFETNIEFFNFANEIYSPVDWVNIIHGSIIKSSEFRTENLYGAESGWLAEDIVNYNSARCFDVDDFEFELALLDSSEFGGFAEFKKVEKKCRFVVLDDINTKKHPATREYCLENHTYVTEQVDDRNGWSIFEMKGD